MDAIYLVVSEDDFLKREALSKLEKKYIDYEVISYDMEESTLDQVIEELDTYQFLSNHKLVIVRNAIFLGSDGKDFDTAKLEKYIQNPNPDNVLVLVTNKLDERKKLVKLIKQVAIIPNVEIDMRTFLRNHLEDYKMENMEIEYLIARCLNHYEKIERELEKLKLYCYDKKEITKSDIDLVVEKSIDDNIFDLVDAITKKEKSVALEIYQELLLHNEEPLKILVMVANQFRLIYQVKVLKEEQNNESEISKMLGVHPYRVKLAAEKARIYSSQALLQYLNQLAKLDLEMKNGETFQNVGFEFFLLNL